MGAVLPWDWIGNMLKIDMEKSNLLLGIIAILIGLGNSEQTEENSARNSKVLPIFQVVRFPNDICVISGGTKNGTCYTAEECSNKGGTNGGSCASGFGVCCVFSAGCGSVSSENCTYFEVNGANSGDCNARICKCSSDICQMRLDFTNFVISGPSTISNSIGKLVGGSVGATGKKVSQKTTCSTDTFSISNAPNVPTVCGTLTGDHVYFDASNECHDLSFNFGQSAIGTTIPTRSFTIKVSQISCFDTVNRAPPGCTQWFRGNSGSGQLKTFNFDQGIHLANQNQIMCVRREMGNCRICYYAAAATDVQLGGKNTKGVIKPSSCCAYGADGMKSTGVYDCLIIPGALKAASPGTAASPAKMCGGVKGIVSATNGPTTTVCSKAVPFRLEFMSDPYELVEDDTEGTTALTTDGAKVQFFQTAC